MKIPQVSQNISPKEQSKISIDDSSLLSQAKTLSSLVSQPRRKALSFPLVKTLINDGTSQLSDNKSAGLHYKLTGIGVCIPSNLNKKLIVISQMPEAHAFNSATQSKIFLYETSPHNIPSEMRSLTFRGLALCQSVRGNLIAVGGNNSLKSGGRVVVWRIRGLKKTDYSLSPQSESKTIDLNDTTTDDPNSDAILYRAKVVAELTVSSSVVLIEISQELSHVVFMTESAHLCLLSSSSHTANHFFLYKLTVKKKKMAFE
ncbi:hypothetical protein RFI_06541 [Reticulomyxa filosa]|uniref:Uncharacterized protein n=1 Tax=Reticulomyxa filosa TaxID=46433 RepID=X6NZ75_RETFI|nr:hypothetical protein RFI_06541 [Reticulomyxa filosa]|eukprot:ETO30582.1 hypothetical protein RFI_06541 [Reticulomyxa filosa]